MPKCTFIKWLPGSGKSTYAKTLWVSIFNRDTARIEYPHLKEKEIWILELDFMRDNIEYDICIDNTHMWKSLLGKIEFAKQLWYDVEVFDTRTLYDSDKEYLQQSLLQNIIREEKVPESVIYEMYLSEIKIDWPVYVCDIDWTLANLDHRLHYIKWEKKDHDSFYNNVADDEPIPAMIDTINALWKNATIILVSGRRNECYWDTMRWLEDYWVRYDYILMRNSWDFSPDTNVKTKIYNRCLKQNNVVWVFDDRINVVDMRRELWLYVFDVNQTRTQF